MPIYGLRINGRGQCLYYNADDHVRPGDYVLIELDKGPIMARIESGPLQGLPGGEDKDLPAIIRIADSSDMATHAQNEELRIQARDFCRHCINERKLDMKLVDVDIFFDRSKYIFYFTSPGRVDFRELVKDLVRSYRARIELRQIGVRHETQRLGAIGNCGRVCCCRGHLRKFAPVTIKMAKEQNLFLNPSKISGICGRLLCCLSYEQENYEKFHRIAPRPGRIYATDKGELKVHKVDMFRETVSILQPNNEEKILRMKEWQALHPVKLKSDPNARDAETDEAAEDDPNLDLANGDE